MDARGGHRRRREPAVRATSPYKVELVDTAEGQISLYTQGDFTDLCRGPHLQNSKPIKALKLTSLAGAYWRGDEHNTQLTRIYGTAFYDAGGPRRVPRAARGGEARATTAGSASQLDLFHLDDARRARRSGTRRGW